MTRFVVRRLVSTALSLAGVLALVTCFLDLIPGDPVEVMLGEQAGEVDRAALRQAIGLDLPLHRQITRFAGELARGELRTSLPPFQERVWPKLREKLPRTAALAAAAMTLALVVSLPLGVVAARRRGGAVDRAAMLFSLLGVSVPRAWLGPVLILLFAIQLRWLPALGEPSLGTLVLPATTLGLAMTAMLSRMTRAAILDVEREDFVRTARAKGLGESAVVWRHVLRNALIPVVTIAGLQFGGLLAGAIVTEKVFNWPGMGTLLLTAIQKRDYNTTRAAVLVFTLLYTAVNLTIDLAYGLIDPRIRDAAGGRR